MPLLGEPRVMYQNTSPSVADCTGPFASDGTFPDPCPLRPWQDAQFVENSFAPGIYRRLHARGRILVRLRRYRRVMEACILALRQSDRYKDAGQ
jgi:hypothetical protein